MKKYTLLIGLLLSTICFGSYLGDPVNVKSGGLGISTVPSAGQVPMGNAGGTGYGLNALSGEATMTSGGVVTLANSAVIGKVLTGYTSGAGTVSATDTILQAIQKLNGNIGAISAGDVSSNTSSSVDSEIALFSGTGGKTIKRATGTGVCTVTSGVFSATSTTGSGNVVLATSPTIVTPTIAKIANLTTNGFVKTSAGDGTLGVQTSPIPTADINASRTINAQTGTTYTFVLADGSTAGGHPLVTASNASAQTYTVPPNSSVAFSSSPATQIDVCALGAGAVTIAAGAGVTINSQGGNKTIAAQYVCVSLFKYAADTWLLIGNLVP